VVDLALAQTPPVVVAQLAASVLPLLGEFAQDEAEARRVLAYARAQELAQMLARTQRYRDDPRLRELANSFRQIASRNPHPDTGPHAMIDRVNELLQRGNFRDVLDDVLPRLRAAGLPPYDQLTVDAIEVVAQLGAAEFDSALLGLDRLLALELTGNHLLHPLRFGLAKILQAVNAALQINEAPADLIRYTTQLITRLKELDRDLAAAMSHE
jgi:hypothetical protein